MSDVHDEKHPTECPGCACREVAERTVVEGKRYDRVKMTCRHCGRHHSRTLWKNRPVDPR